MEHNKNGKDDDDPDRDNDHEATTLAVTMMASWAR
jgi:hypothetical protein